MKILIDRREFLGCKSWDEALALIASKGMDIERPFAISGAYDGAFFAFTQEDLKKERSHDSVTFNYCYSCKETTEMCGEHCAECHSYIGT